jgi:hypothetical protein
MLGPYIAGQKHMVKKKYYCLIESVCGKLAGLDSVAKLDGMGWHALIETSHP